MTQPHVVRAAIEERLTTRPLQTAWGLTKLEYHSGSRHAKRENGKGPRYVFRMPDSIVLDDLWSVIEETCAELQVTVQRVGTYHTVEELDDLLGSIEWLWPKWLARGFLTLFVGDPGTGKSMIALDFVHRAIVTTLGWPLEPKTAGAPDGSDKAIWVETESSQQLLNLRTKSMHLPRKRILLPDFQGDILGQPDLGNENDQARLAMYVKANKPRIIVVDSLGGGSKRGENKVEEVRPMLQFLANLARDYDVAIIAIHHLRKSSGEDWEEVLTRVRGSSAFIAFPRMVIALERLANDALKLSVIKSNISAPPKPLSVNVIYEKDEPKHVEYAEYSAPAAKRTRKQQATTWVFEYLTKNGQSALTDILSAAEAEGYTRGLLYQARDGLGESLEQSGDGKKVFWVLAANPFAALQGNSNGK